MKDIKLSYDSAEIEISTFLLLFFRLSGIYVYEKFLDFDKRREEAMLSSVDNKNIIATEMADTNIGLYIISEENRQYLQSIINHQIPTNSEINGLIYEQGVLTEQDEVAVKEGDIDFLNFSTKEELLEKIIDFLYQKKMIDEEERCDLKIVKACYLNYDIRDLLTVSKFFYKIRDEEAFEKFTQSYVEAIKSIPATIFDTQHWHSQYAKLYLGYEVNMLCKGYDKQRICSNEYIEKKLKSMLSEHTRTGESQIILLLAQTYDDLFGEYNISYEYYLMACNKKNAFAYFKKGEYWNKYGKRPEKAIKYYERSVSLFPEYHKAWYNLGVSNFNMGNMDKALTAFKNVNLILSKKKKYHNLSQIDMEYLYKACSLSGYIYNKFYSDYSKAIKYDLIAVDVWKSIEQNIFGITNESKYYYMINNNILKKKLNVEKMYHILYQLFETIGSKELAEEFKKQMQ